MSTTTAKITVDSRGRTSLAKIEGVAPGEYLVDTEPGGRVVLTPAVTLSAIELAVLRDPTLHKSLTDGLETPKDQLVTRKRPR